MTGDPGVDALIRQWAAERERSPEDQEVDRIATAWLAEAPQVPPGIPGQRGRGGASRWEQVDATDPGLLAAMRQRLPGVPAELITAAAGWWQMVGDVDEAERWWDAGMSPLDQRALDYRAAGLTPDDLARRLGPLTVLEHLRRGSAPAWCVARLARQRRDAAG
ncbi:transcriptional regulator [Amycolatopsis antarctica]|uniref:Transcriptional regulator n=1 Tax=Amycolatopsis antarctica TaxID=1854586 RepID=A0A263D7P5_9PSEU|nr:transcriptional regulator [Amycolatopsis antarctica]OZM74554.1 transcriptional regulator [Amycolatopsis antarctica]